MTEPVRSCALSVEAICPRCKRPYYLEQTDDPGVCCICHRDDVMTLALGIEWRLRLQEGRAATHLKGKK